MKLENLKVGMEVKNYPELCKLLELEPNTGYSKIRQMEWVDEYVEYEKKGNRFIIKSISDKEVEPMEDNRGGAHNTIEYIDSLEKLMLNLMLQGKDKKMISFSKSSMMKYLKLVNQNYGISKGNINTVSKIINIDNKLVEEWFNSTDSMLQGNIERTLNNLENQRLVMWDKRFTVCVQEIVETKLVPTGEVLLNEFGEKIRAHREIPVKSEEIYREATVDEGLLITRVEREAIKEMGYNNIQAIAARKLWDKFYEKTKSALQESSDIKFYYRSYNVFFNKDHIEQEVIKLDDFELSTKEKEENETIVNEGVQNRNITNAERRQNGTHNSKTKHRLDDKYIDNYKTLNNIMIDFNPDLKIYPSDISKHNRNKTSV